MLVQKQCFCNQRSTVCALYWMSLDNLFFTLLSYQAALRRGHSMGHITNCGTYKDALSHVVLTVGFLCYWGRQVKLLPTSTPCASCFFAWRLHLWDNAEGFYKNVCEDPKQEGFPAMSSSLLIFTDISYVTVYLLNNWGSLFRLLTCLVSWYTSVHLVYRAPISFFFDSTPC